MTMGAEGGGWRAETGPRVQPQWTVTIILLGTANNHKIGSVVALEVLTLDTTKHTVLWVGRRVIRKEPDVSEERI
jgi:hypothetical protein